jgi:ribosomal 30S subunit maturation factor RimM
VLPLGKEAWLVQFAEINQRELAEQVKGTLWVPTADRWVKQNGGCSETVLEG